MAQEQEFQRAQVAEKLLKENQDKVPSVTRIRETVTKVLYKLISEQDLVREENPKNIWYGVLEEKKSLVKRVMTPTEHRRF